MNLVSKCRPEVMNGTYRVIENCDLDFAGSQEAKRGEISCMRVILSSRVSRDESENDSGGELTVRRETVLAMARELLNDDQARVSRSLALLSRSNRFPISIYQQALPFFYSNFLYSSVA